jgi:hypothetical protein
MAKKSTDEKARQRWRGKYVITNLLKIENQIQLTYIAEEMVKNLHKQVDTFKVHELIVSNVNTQGEEETRISPVYYFVCPKL